MEGKAGVGVGESPPGFTLMKVRFLLPLVLFATGLAAVELSRKPAKGTRSLSRPSSGVGESAADKPTRSDRAGRVPANPAIDDVAFADLSVGLATRRERRRVPVERFIAMASEPNTVLLDTRSRSAYDRVHLAGAVHLNFSDLTAEKLRKVIGSKDTRVLIYCNNNFVVEPGPKTKMGTASEIRSRELADALAVKAPALALNLPTFINLVGYGYRDIYELADRIGTSDPRIRLEGTAVRIGAAVR